MEEKQPAHSLSTPSAQNSLFPRTCTNSVSQKYYLKEDDEEISLLLLGGHENHRLYI